MMIFIISECEKKALKRTRRVLDAFANRIGNNTWQTVITEDGLKALHTLLRRTASKSTAVSCHWLRSRSRSDLLWVVGDRSAFDATGQVPVNRTRRNLIPQDWQNNWANAQAIQIVATLAALLHDIGKSTVGFQDKLAGSGFSGDPFRHEWISLRLFMGLIEGCQTDFEWLERFKGLNAYLTQPHQTLEFLASVRPLDERTQPLKMHTYPPLAQWIAWLIVTHHRLAPLSQVFISPQDGKPDSTINLLKNPGHNFLDRPAQKFYQLLKPHDYWVKNPKALLEDKRAQLDSFWQFDQLVIHSPLWQKALARWCQKALQEPHLNQLLDHAKQTQTAINDPWLLMLSRLSLMIGDHNYSSLNFEDRRRVTGSPDFKNLSANTQRQTTHGYTTSTPKQALDEHLLGVASFTAHFARVLPQLKTALPGLTSSPKLEANTRLERFAWQNQAAKVARAVQADSRVHGFFGINLASTGCGKTIANARIMHALADPQSGSRFTIALGLRVLTLQTGESLRRDLDLDDHNLAVLIGSSAHQTLYELSPDQTERLGDLDSAFGSESSEELLSEELQSSWTTEGLDNQQIEELRLGTVIEGPKARALLFSPIVSCTVDHLIQASECRRGGKYIAPLLRLLSSDLVLDEPDDFSPSDLPALSRLVHLAGVFGSRVLLSSATLPPDMLCGLFEAYRTGRIIHNRQLKLAAPEVICSWFDEQRTTTERCCDQDHFSQHAQHFAQKRADFLSQLAVRRRADILPIHAIYQQEKTEQFYLEVGRSLIAQAVKLHHTHAIAHPKTSQQLSIGVIRIANIKHIVALAQAIHAADTSDLLPGTQLHLCVYHASQLLALRNQLENALDSLLKRSGLESDIFKHPAVAGLIQSSSKTHHIFVVLASPVCEVGRDHDFDWAIAEPSSMRSLIQLAGRVWRHRPDKVASAANISILQKNFNQLTGKSAGSIYVRPGFEDAAHKLTQHSADQVLTTEQLAQIDSRARLLKPTQLRPTELLADLEHQVTADLFGTQTELATVVTGYFTPEQTASRQHTHLPQITQFRAGRAQFGFTAQLGDAGEIQFYLSDLLFDKTSNHLPPPSDNIHHQPLSLSNPSVTPWLASTLAKALEKLGERTDETDLNRVAKRYASVGLEGINDVNFKGYFFSEAIGFWKRT